MDSNIELCIKRSDNELVLASVIDKVSENESIKKDILKISKENTFYSAVISHAYYSIFYIAKAYLLSQGVKFEKQGQHQKVHFEFKKLVKKGNIDAELLKVYEVEMIKAEALLDILDKEKQKRSEFTYEQLPQANKDPARDSIDNATLFVSHVKALINKK